MESADCKTNSMPVKSRAQIDSIYSGGPALACHKWYQITKKSGLSGLHLNLNRVSNPNCQCCKWPLTVHRRYEILLKPDTYQITFNSRGLFMSSKFQPQNLRLKFHKLAFMVMRCFHYMERVKHRETLMISLCLLWQFNVLWTCKF